MTSSEQLGTAASSQLLNATTALAVPHSVRRVHTRQNWVLDPFQDTLLIIAAPLISLGLALWAMQRYGAVEAAAMVILAHVILTVAHHMPTFIRIYGDVDLFKRFKWNFVLGPVIPLCFSSAVLGYINYHQYPVEYFLYLYIFLAMWDPWHFLRQHFGFMRIYDRHNAAPKSLASNMDWWICTVWFVHIMVASSDWLPGLLEDLYRSVHIPLLLSLPTDALQYLIQITYASALIMSVMYVAYLLWCWRQGYYVSPAKLGLLGCTFGVMYLTYTPNELILAVAPAWSFKVGFATVGIVHMTQYMAIVWRYDQRIAQQPGRARRGWFAWLHARRSRLGIIAAAAAYVLFCVAYGDAITSSHGNRWLMSALLAVGFTSTLMHYYFDGFIWKIRHQQNRDALDVQSSGSPYAYAIARRIDASWWTAAAEMTAGRMLLRQVLYFGIPMGILTVGALSVWNAGNTSYVQHMYQAQSLNQQGSATAAAEAARFAYARMQTQLPLARKLAELKPNSAHEAELAFLIYNESLYENLVMPQLAGQQTTHAQQNKHRRNIIEASNLLLSAFYRGGDVRHAGRETLSAQQARDIALSWQRQVH